MKIRKVFKKTVTGGDGDSNVAGGFHAVIAANVGESGRSKSSVSSRQRIVQKSGKTTVTEDSSERRDG
jgi:hypothetical protein